MVDLPTPPLAEETATTFWTFGMRRLGGSPRLGIWGGGRRDGSPWRDVSDFRSPDDRVALLKGFHVEAGAE